MSAEQSVAILGTGAMGAPVAARLAAAGYKVTVWNRSRERAEPLAAQGITIADSAPQAVQAGDVVVLLLADAEAIQATLFPACDLTGRLIIQMGTIGPEESRDLARRVTEAGGRYLECPVLGSIPEAREGRLILMAGGDETAYREADPLLRVMGPEPMRIGPVGQGAAVKLAFNHLIGALTTAFSLSLGLIRREGVEVEQYMELLRGSALYASTYDKKLDKMLSRDFGTANFSARHLVKDLRLFREAAEAAGLSAGAMDELIRIAERSAEANPNADYSALYELIDPGPEKRH